MEEEFLCRKDAFSKALLSIISFKVKELWNLIMDKVTKEHGLLMKNMVKVSIHGLMVVHIKVNIRMEREKDME